MSITKLILTINGEEIIVTFDEAKKLYDELSIIFGVSRADIPNPLFPKDIGNPFDYRKIPPFDSPIFTD